MGNRYHFNVRGAMVVVFANSLEEATKHIGREHRLVSITKFGY